MHRLSKICQTTCICTLRLPRQIKAPILFHFIKAFHQAAVGFKGEYGKTILYFHIAGFDRCLCVVVDIVFYDARGVAEREGGMAGAAAKAVIAGSGIGVVNGALV